MKPPSTISHVKWWPEQITGAPSPRTLPIFPGRAFICSPGQNSAPVSWQPQGDGFCQDRRCLDAQRALLSVSDSSLDRALGYTTAWFPGPTPLSIPMAISPDIGRLPSEPAGAEALARLREACNTSGPVGFVQTEGGG